MATGASNADLAILLVDARKGLLTQTHRHSLIVSLLGIRHVVLAVNKIDLVDFSQKAFDDIVAAYREFAEPLGFKIAGRRSRSRRASATTSRRAQRAHALVRRADAAVASGDARTSTRTARGAPFRLPVQWVNRPNLDFRGFAGTIASGRVSARRRDRRRRFRPRRRKVASLYVADAAGRDARRPATR